MKKIIIPTDFSENAFNALKCAIQYFSEAETKFIIVHGLELQAEETRTQCAEKLDHLLERVEYLKYNKLHQFETQVLAGALIHELKDVVRIENADLIVMGTKGRTQNRKICFGSNTLQVIKQIECPVLAIPLEMEYKSPDRILFPTQLSAYLPERELELLSDLAYQHVSALHLLHISEQEELSTDALAYIKLLESRFRESEIIYKRHAPGHQSVIVNNYVRKQHIDLLVLINSKHAFLESFLQQPGINSLELDLQIPFLILQNITR